MSLNKMRIFVVLVIGSVLLLSIAIPFIAPILVVLIILLYWKSQPSEPIVNNDNVSVDIIQKNIYLNSKKWCILRHKVLTRDNYKCVKCKDTQQLEVHHITYSNLYNENLSDLVTLCRYCHQEVHNKYGYSHKTIYPINKRK